MFRYDHKTYYIGTARFNTRTYQENEDFRKVNCINGCIYGFPIPIHEEIPQKATIFIIEMLNQDKCGYITGIGCIQNKCQWKEKYRIYSNREYNRSVYKGSFLLKRQDMNDKQLTLIKRLDWLLFHGKSHMKRSTGICMISDNILDRVNLKNMLIDILRNHEK
jgi:hypothetical protein